MALHSAVKYTEAGWIDNVEVVKVFSMNLRFLLVELNNYAKKVFFALNVSQDFKTDESPQYYLSKSSFRYLPLTKVQRSRINVAILYNSQPEKYLSPKQTRMYEDILKGISNNLKAAITKKIYQIHGIGLRDKVLPEY